jgi:hypothetical protein
VSQLDQPRPDLDAALDAVIPSLTAVGDDAAAQSLRRTRIALAKGTASASPRGWRWAMPAAAAVAAAIFAAVVFWPPAGAIDTPRVAVRTPVPAPAVLPSEPVRVAPSAPAPAPIQQTRLARAPRVAAASAPRPDDSPRPDPLVALVAAVQEIPDDAWARGVAAASAPLIVADVAVAPIVIDPITTPPITDSPAEPIAPGEP